MTTVELTPPEAARWAARAALVLPVERHAAVAAVADHIHGVVAVLRELDFSDVPPAAHQATEQATEQATAQEPHDAAV